MNDNAGPNEPIVPRAWKVATGFADIGLTSAEEWLRRMSPEGREQARRERAAKARRQRRLLMRLIVAMAASLIVWASVAAIAAPDVALGVASALMLLLTMTVLLRADPRAPGREALAQAALPNLAEEADIWLAAHNRGLPAPAIQLTSEIRRRLGHLAPHIGAIDPQSPASAALQKLIAVELPVLIEGWRNVPISARRLPLADGRTPDDHLINGLRLIETELAEASAQVSSGALNEIAVHGRYLELKYSRDDRFM